MPHLVLEVARRSIERRLLTIPVETDASGAPADILAPPVPIRRTIPTALSTIRTQLIVRTVTLQTVTGSSQCVLALTFNEGSVELLSLGQSEGLLAGTIAIPFTMGFVAAPASRGGQVAQLVASFASTSVAFAFDLDSKARLVARAGLAMADMVEAAIRAALTLQFKALGAQPTGLNLELTPGVPSEKLLTVIALPGVLWVNPETLAVSLEYAPESPVLPAIPPVPFLPAGDTSAFGLRLNHDGFQRTVRNPAVRKIARDMLSARLIDGFVQNVYAERGGQGGITDQDRAEGKTRLDAFLLTAKGRADLANETPAPTGNGKLRKRITKVPDPFSDFDVEIPELDLWLGHDRIEGRARATGEVNGFGFTADIRFRARPALVTGPSVAIEMHDVEIDDPDVKISLPVWLDWAFGILVSVIAGPVFGAIAGFLFASIISALAEAFIPSNLGSRVPPQNAQPISGLPAGVKLNQLEVFPDHLTILGRWSVFIDDPRPFYPRVSIVDTVDRSRVGLPREGRAWFVCLGVLGTVMDSNEQYGTPFEYLDIAWESHVKVAVEATAVPLPLTRFPWTIEVGHRSTAQYHFPMISSDPQPLVPGRLTFTSEVWRPEPPLTGQVSTRTFSIDVERAGEDTFTLFVPRDAGCIIVLLKTRVIDAAGVAWDLSTIIDVPNETVTFGPEFDDFTHHCEGGRREWQFLNEPSLLDRIWNPPDVFARAVERAIRAELPGVTAEIGSLIEERGPEAFQLILAPSLARQH